MVGTQKFFLNEGHEYNLADIQQLIKNELMAKGFSVGVIDGDLCVERKTLFSFGYKKIISSRLVESEKKMVILSVRPKDHRVFADAGICKKLADDLAIHIKNVTSKNYISERQFTPL